ncbi:hypothetical protein [Microbaculum sp. FT89]|uniref:hypothetical protein n=1 Tax=Microbaculum sp. FT89 TaxID=3447298 RepID=UPI003F52C5FC
MIRFLVAILAGILGAGLGLVAGWFVGEILARLFDVSCFEGACGYFVGLIAIVGGLVGLVAGPLIALVAGRRRAGGPAQADAAAPGRSGAKTAGQFVGAIAVTVALAAGGTWLYAWLGDDSLGGPNRAPPQLHYEIRFGAGTALPDRAAGVDVQLDTEKNQAWGDLFDDWNRRDGDRPMIAGFFELYFRARSRVLSVKLPEGPRYIFVLKLPRAPGHMAAYTDWHPADAVDEGGSAQPRAATGEEGVDIRYRVVYAGED